MEPLVSVIIPVYNGEKYIEKTISSALQQSYNNIEIIVVNDGSSDNSENILKGFGEKVKLINQKNQRQAVARNIGIKNANGIYCAFLDQDDLWHKDKIKCQVKLLEKYKAAGMTYCDHNSIDERGNVVGTTGALTYPRWSGKILDNLLTGNCILSASLVMVRKQVLTELDGVDETQPHWSDDWDLWMRIAIDYPILYQIKTLVSYRRHANNTSGNNFELCSGNLHALYNIKKIVKSKGLKKQLQVINNEIYKGNISVGWHLYNNNLRRKAKPYYWEAIKYHPLKLKLWYKYISSIF